MRRLPRASSSAAHERGTARDHRAGDQPHLRPASVVPARAPGAARLAASATSTSGATPTRSTPARASSSPTPRRRTGPGTRSPRPYYWHRFFSHQPDLNFDNPRVLEAVLDVDALLARHGRRRAAARRHSLPVRARRHELREPARDARGPQEDPRRARRATIPDRMLLAEANQWPEDDRAVFRRRRRMPHGVPLPADAAHVHGDRAGGPAPDHRHHAPDAGDPRRLPVGDLPAQPRRADARDGDRRGARLPVARSTPPTGARASTSASAAGWRRCWRTTGARSS